MLDAQSFMLLGVTFLTCGCAGFIIGISMALPIKQKLAEQIMHEMRSHLRELQTQQEKENVGGFRLGAGRAIGPAEHNPSNVIKWRE